ncbi:hypothetical protein BCU68_11605 [Vibrio sp. 10N.286.49.B3]|uniref:hypothetical protein n=1 Tax=Vibrio sp. 10N.286.49.B3 TaxID=1880855 RepID=UPI000C86736A|nr:hypothetical protein [Vibrio sp. 10N.286.49.B3]PMH44790.1 hypothetical protein BCU68_11605 [Vibrio sp. 10N.286.49.B3]
MPSKSDSAGKLHQYFTALTLKQVYPESQLQSPLLDEIERNSHLSLFSDDNIASLKHIGDLSANEIKKHIGEDNVINIEDIGIASGASGFRNTDDLEITTDSNKVIAYSLKCATSISQILSKNMGAKSLISSYFSSPKHQEEFNSYFEEARLCFLNKFFDGNEKSINLLSKHINSHANKNGVSKARFTDFPHMDDYRDVFLRTLRDCLMDKINDIEKSKLSDAVNLILDTNKNHIIAVYGRKNSAKYSRVKDKNQHDIVSVYSRGNDSVVINTGDYEVGFRYKFESGITSSIKLVGDYKKLMV